MYQARALLEWKELYGPSFCSTSETQIADPDSRKKAAAYRAVAEMHHKPWGFRFPESAEAFRESWSLHTWAAIDKALSSAFGNGTPAYMRYNLAATLDAGPLITDATLRSSVPRPVGGPRGHDLQVQEARQYFSEGKERSIALLRKAIGTLEDDIANAPPIVDKQRVVAAVQESMTTLKAGDVPTPPGQVGGGLDLKAVWGRVGQWWRRRVR
jgi:hypothetical protein